MSNPWETSNPWGKGSKEWNRWMAPEKVGEPEEARPTNQADLDSLLALEHTYIDEFGLLLYDYDTQLKESIRTIRRIDGLSIRRSKVSPEEKAKSLLAKSRPLIFDSAEAQTSIALDLLRRSKEQMIELMCYIAYNYTDSRIRFFEEKFTEENDQYNSESYHSWATEPKIIGPMGSALHHFMKGNKEELIIGTFHTHPTGEDSFMSEKDIKSNAQSALPVMAIQDKKVLYLGVSSFAKEETHLLSNGAFDFVRFSIKNYIKSRFYAQ